MPTLPVDVSQLLDFKGELCQHSFLIRHCRACLADDLSHSQLVCNVVPKILFLRSFVRITSASVWNPRLSRQREYSHCTILELWYSASKLLVVSTLLGQGVGYQQHIKYGP